jgi:hypothetical protein
LDEERGRDRRLDKNSIMRMRWARNSYKTLLGNRERKKLFGRPMRIWEDNIKIDLG